MAAERPFRQAAHVEGSEYLFTCAEVSAALAGFSALVVAISDRGDSRVRSLSKGLVGTLIERSLVAIFFSLAPLLLAGLDVAAPHVWLACSGGLAAYVLSLAWRSAAIRRAEPEQTEYIEGPTFAILMILGVGVLALQIANAFGFAVQQGVWWYLTGLTWLLMSVSYLFYFGVRHWARAT